ncbi:MAG: type IV pilus assembly protein PilM [Patescibacteria group bacterium]|nr:type IV pilus assembly protein PilM [Patescibacteria group bacterium]MDD5567209.1 type IV pilus assembly protein PilM [Patescibacteria group bacterium]
MGLFSKKEGYIGIDLGTSGIKVVELSNDDGKRKLVTYGYTEQPINVVKSDSQETQEKAVKIIKEICKKAKVSSNRVISALPSFTVFSAIINLPNMSRKELTSAVRWEAKKFVPMPIEEMILDWKVLSEEGKPNSTEAEPKVSSGATQGEEKKGKNINILLTAAPRNLVQRYLNIFKALNLKLVGLETEAFALERSLIGHDKSAIMIVDIGGLNTNVSVIRESIPLLNRSIDVGGETITRTIANGLNVDLNRAEQFKRDFGMTSSDEGGQQQIPKTIEFVVSSIINEIKYCFNLYQNQSLGQTSTNRAIEKVILTGGSAMLPALTEYLSKVLNMRVYIGDPWSRVSYPEELKPVLQELGPRFSVAIGLAMREIY